jgi:hemerythrin-like domain-containing protein
MTPPELQGQRPSEVLSLDHDRLDGLLRDARAAAARDDLDRARQLLGEFRDGLERHIRLEEEVLFPAFEERTGITRGPTVVMRYEHTLIRAFLSEMTHALGGDDAAGFGTAATALEGILGPHNVKEENVLYPAVDRALSPDELALLAARLREG